MPIFQYEAMNQAGQEVKDEIEALSTEEALAKIKSLGYYPTKIKEKGARRVTAARGRGGLSSISIGGVKKKALTQFTRQLSTLQDAGLPILRSLRILEEQQKPGPLKNIIRNVADEVESGATLSEAMAKNPKAFDRLYVNMVAAGEAGGVLDVILQRLADFMEKAQRLKRKVVGAMIYPAMVISFAGAIVMGIMIFVVPKFEQIFSDFGTDLPKMTKFLIRTSNWIIGRSAGAEEGGFPGWVIILLFPIGFWLVLKLIRLTKPGKYWLDWISLHLPIFGPLLQRTAVARFTRTLGTLVSAGVPILDAINITRETAGNEVYARALGKVHDAIREGESFAGPLRAARVCDGLVINMIDVGEETGELDKMLYKIADTYDEEVETQVASLVSLLEPLMVIMLGGIVGFIVVSLFLPLVSLINAVSGGAGGG